MKKMIVTGATGFIGGALTKKLLLQGERVYGIDINAKRLEEMKQYGDFVPVVADFSAYDRLEELISERGFDYCVHTAWAGSLGGKDLYDHELQNFNIQSACKLFDKADKLGVKRVIFCCSSYQDMVKDGYDFTVNYYGIAKKAASDYCLAICARNGIECNIAVLTNTYGTGDRSQKAVNTFISKMQKGEEIKLIEGNKRNDWVYIDDTVEGLIRAAESPYAFRHYYIGHRVISSFKEKLLMMKETLKSSSELRFGEYPDDTYVNYDKLDLNALYNDTGFECRSDFKESILKTSEWLRSIGR